MRLSSVHRPLIGSLLALSLQMAINHGAFAQTTPQQAFDDIGSLAGKTGGEVFSLMVSKGWNVVPSRDGRGQVFTKDLGNGTTAAVRADPPHWGPGPSIAQPHDPLQAGEYSHFHKETVPTNQIGANDTGPGNYNTTERQGLVRYNDDNQALVRPTNGNQADVEAYYRDSHIRGSQEVVPYQAGNSVPGLDVSLKPSQADQLNNMAEQGTAPPLTRGEPTWLPVPTDQTRNLPVPTQNPSQGGNNAAQGEQPQDTQPQNGPGTAQGNQPTGTGSTAQGNQPQGGPGTEQGGQPQSSGAAQTNQPTGTGGTAQGNQPQGAPGTEQGGQPQGGAGTAQVEPTGGGTGQGNQPTGTGGTAQTNQPQGGGGTAQVEPTGGGGTGQGSQPRGGGGTGQGAQSQGGGGTGQGTQSQGGGGGTAQGQTPQVSPTTAGVAISTATALSTCIAAGNPVKYCVAAAIGNLPAATICAAAGTVPGYGPVLGLMCGSANTFAACVAKGGDPKKCLNDSRGDLPVAAFCATAGAFNPMLGIACGVVAPSAADALVATWKAGQAEAAAQQQAAQQQPISNAWENCDFQTALGLAQGLEQDAMQRGEPQPAWLQTIWPTLQKGAAAQSQVSSLLTQASSTTDQTQKQQLLNQALAAAGDIACLKNQVNGALQQVTQTTPASPPVVDRDSCRHYCMYDYVQSYAPGAYMFCTKIDASVMIDKNNPVDMKMCQGLIAQAQAPAPAPATHADISQGSSPSQGCQCPVESLMSYGKADGGFYCQGRDGHEYQISKLEGDKVVCLSPTTATAMPPATGLQSAVIPTEAPNPPFSPHPPTPITPAAIPATLPPEENPQISAPRVHTPPKIHHARPRIHIPPYKPQVHLARPRIYFGRPQIHTYANPVLPQGGTSTGHQY